MIKNRITIGNIPAIAWGRESEESEHPFMAAGDDEIVNQWLQDNM